MNKETLVPKNKASTGFFVLGTITIVILGLVKLETLLKPLIIAGLIWFIINQLKLSIEKISIKGRSIPRVVAGAFAILIIFIIIYLIIELLILNLEGIVSSMPEYVSNFEKITNTTSSWFKNPKYTNLLSQWINALDLAGVASSVINSLSGTIANIAVILVYVIFFLME